MPFNNLCVADNSLGRFEQAVTNCLQALRINPDQVFPYNNLVESYIALHRLPEARQIIEQAFARKLEDPDLHLTLFQIAYGLGDSATMDAQRKWAAGRPEESQLTAMEGEILASAGRIGAARTAFARAEAAAAGLRRQQIRSRLAFIAAAVGETSGARAILATLDATRPSVAMLEALITAAIADDRADAERFVAMVPDFLPVIGRGMAQNAKLLLDIHAGNPNVLSQVSPASGGDVLPGGPALRPIFLRGTLYLRAGAAPEAIAEFQRILDHRESNPGSIVHPVARLQQSRAYVMTGDSEKARRGYQDFLAAWKDADPDVPALVQAKAEYAKLPPK